MESSAQLRRASDTLFDLAEQHDADPTHDLSTGCAIAEAAAYLADLADQLDGCLALASEMEDAVRQVTELRGLSADELSRER